METNQTNTSGMFLENESRYGFNETVEKLTEQVGIIGWRVLNILDLQAILHEKGKEVLPIKIFEVCNAKHAGRILEKDVERMYSSLLPCRISVYQTSDGKTRISRMNSGSMAAQIGGLTEEVMSIAFAEMETALKTIEV